MRDNPYESFDKAMSSRLRAIYSDPARHAFMSCHEALRDSTGPRGGKIRGRKAICYHCGAKRAAHAQKDEEL